MELPEKRRGRPLLVGSEIEEKVLNTIRHAGGIVNYHIAIAADSNLLVENGGHIDINKDWPKQLLGRMNLVKQHMTTKAKVKNLLINFENLKKQYLNDIYSIVLMKKIPKDLIIKWNSSMCQSQIGLWNKKGRNMSKLQEVKTRDN